MPYSDNDPSDDKEMGEITEVNHPTDDLQIPTEVLDLQTAASGNPTPLEPGVPCTLASSPLTTDNLMTSSGW